MELDTSSDGSQQRVVCTAGTPLENLTPGIGTFRISSLVERQIRVEFLVVTSLPELDGESSNRPSESRNSTMEPPE